MGFGWSLAYKINLLSLLYSDRFFIFSQVYCIQSLLYSDHFIVFSIYDIQLYSVGINSVYRGVLECVLIGLKKRVPEWSIKKQRVTVFTYRSLIGCWWYIG